MLITRSNVKVVDNTGVKQVYIVIDSGTNAKVGDTVTCVIQRVRSTSCKFSKGGLARLQIINTRFGYTCLDGTTISSIKSNDGILVSKGGDPLGTRISTPFSRQHFRRIGFTKVLSMTPFSFLFSIITHRKSPFLYLFFIYYFKMYVS